MTDKEKLEKIKELADKMYSNMAYLTSDTRPIRKAMDEYHQFIVNEYHKEEPISEDLNTAAKEYANNITDKLGYRLQLRRAVCFGANWQIGQFEKNSLAACDAQTEEEAEVERDFVFDIIEKEHRPPTFDDAIKYGMRLQKEQLMAKAVDGTLLGGHLIKQEGITHPLHSGDKVKVITINAD